MTQQIREKTTDAEENKDHLHTQAEAKRSDNAGDGRSGTDSPATEKTNYDDRFARPRRSALNE